MSGSSEQPTSPPSDQPGKTRTWWHPLFVRLLQHELSGAYDVREEVPVGKVPLRLDVVLIRRGQQQLPAAAARKLAALVQRLNRFTVVEFKSPSDTQNAGIWTTCSAALISSVRSSRSRFQTPTCH